MKIKTKINFTKKHLWHWDKIDKNFGRIKDDDPEKIEIFLNAVICRMINIYKEWLDNYINA